MPYRVMVLEDLREYAAAGVRGSSYELMLASALNALEEEDWQLVTVEASGDAETRWYFHQPATVGMGDGLAPAASGPRIY